MIYGRTKVIFYYHHIFKLIYHDDLDCKMTIFYQLTITIKYKLCNHLMPVGPRVRLRVISIYNVSPAWHARLNFYLLPTFEKYTFYGIICCLLFKFIITFPIQYLEFTI